MIVRLPGSWVGKRCYDPLVQSAQFINRHHKRRKLLNIVGARFLWSECEVTYTLNIYPHTLLGAAGSHPESALFR